MHFNSRLVLSLLSTIPTALAAVNGKCSNGKKGICIATGTCGKYKGTTSSGNCPNDPNNIKCCSNIPCKANGATGSCVFTDECKATGGTAYSGLCPGGNNFKCCIPKQKKSKSNGVGQTCTNGNQSGTCIDINKTSCSGGRTVTGKCPGPANVKCCIKASGVGQKCYGNGKAGTCIDVKTTGCGKGYTVSGRCPGAAANVMCCVKDPVPGKGTGQKCYSNGKSGTCKDVRVTGCGSGYTAGVQCPNADAGVMCCVKESGPAKGVGQTCHSDGKTGICKDVKVTGCDSGYIASIQCPNADSGVMCCIRAEIKPGPPHPTPEQPKDSKSN